MPYLNGEHPMVRDVVSDSAQKVGVVTRVNYYGSEIPELTIHWADETVGIRNHPDDLVLVERAAEILTLRPQ